LLKPQLVAITPDYGYVDGCIDVTLSGHKLGETATAKIGTLDLELTAAPNDPNIEDYKEDVGFEYTAQVGAAPEGAGWYDVTMTVDGEELVLKNGFYFRSCPATVHLDIFDAPPDPDPYTPGHPLTAGEQLAMQGCGLTDQVTVEFVDISGAPPCPPRSAAAQGPGAAARHPPSHRRHGHARHAHGRHGHWHHHGRHHRHGDGRHHHRHRRHGHHRW
jgi:hypothetical protein